MPLESMPGLGDALASYEGEAAVSIQCMTALSGRKTLTGRVQAQLQVICQRCLQAVSIDLDDEFDLAVLEYEQPVEDVDKGTEPWMLDEQSRIDVYALVQEQILLGLPIVSYHDDCEAMLVTDTKDEPDQQITQAADNPFAVLAKLKKE